MTRYIRQVAEWGIGPETSTVQAQHYRLTNVLLLFMFFASIFETIVCFLTGAIDAAMLNTTAPFVFGGGLLLVKTGRTVLARLFVISLGYTAGYAMVASLGPESYFQFIFLFAGAFAIALFSAEEKWLLTLGLTGPVLCFALLEINHYEPVLGMTRAVLGGSQLIAMRIVSMIIIWSLMVFHFFYFIRDRRRSQEQLVSSAKMVAMGRMAASDPFREVPVQSIVMLALDFCRAHLESQQIELRVKDIPEDLSVIGRETQLSEVVLNVLNNAYDAVLDSAQKWIQISAVAEKEWVEIAITDSGPGVNPKLRQRIFDPFFTTKPLGKGTGLGLSVSQGIMAAHGGQIYFDPKSAGARFVIRIPRVIG